MTHVLVAYAVATVLSMRYRRITPALVTTAMAGATIPDLNRMDLLVPAVTVESLLDVPFSWDAFHTLGGALVVAAVGATLVPDDLRRRVFALLALGVLSHLTLDLFLLSPSGYAHEVLWPLSSYAPPAGGLYLSSDRWPVVVAAALAGGVRYVAGRDSKRERDSPSGRD